MSGLTRAPRWVPRCDGGNCRLARGHIGRCALTPFGVVHRRMRDELEVACFAALARGENVTLLGLQRVIGP